MGGVMATTSNIIIREAYSKPSHKDSGQIIPLNDRQIRFRHPGYDDPDNLLLAMPALDPGGGIHHATARIACGIIAGNRWDGYFTTDKAGQDEVERSPDTILMGVNYYFHIPNITGKQAT